eukprot:377199-Alexandrium_andersonii.AAC.1
MAPPCLSRQQAPAPSPPPGALAPTIPPSRHRHWASLPRGGFVPRAQTSPQPPPSLAPARAPA